MVCYWFVCLLFGGLIFLVVLGFECFCCFCVCDLIFGVIVVYVPCG